MATHLALIRGINVAAARRLSMADLRAAAEGAGLRQVRTLLQSGNLVFDAPGADIADLEVRLETALAGYLGPSSEVMARSAGQWRALVAANPLADAAAADPAHLVAVVLKSAPEDGAQARLTAAISGPEVARVVGDTAYIHYPAGIGDSRLTAAVIDRALGVRGTARNWNTVLKLASLVAEQSA